MNYKEEIYCFVPKTSQEIQDKKVMLQYMDCFGDTLLTRDNVFAHFTSSGLILNPQLDKMLMVYHNIYQTWTWTGGHADGNGNLYEVAKKEAMEETGITHFLDFPSEMASLDILTVNGHWKNGNYVSSHIHLSAAYILIASQEEAVRVKPDENQGVQWIPVNEMKRYSNEAHIIPIYQKIIERAKALA